MSGPAAIVLLSLLAASAWPEDAVVLGVRGAKSYNDGDTDLALKYLEMALVEAEKRGNQLQMSQLLMNIGLNYAKVYDESRAREYFHRALAIQTRLGGNRLAAEILRNIANSYLSEGDATQAAVYYRRAAELYREMEDKKGEKECLEAIQNAQRGEEPGTPYFYQKALEKARADGGKKREEMEALIGLAEIARTMKNHQEALENDQQALLVARTLKDTKREAQLYSSLSLDAYQTSDLSGALAYAQSSAQLFARIGDNRGEGGARLFACEIRTSQDDFAGQGEADCRRASDLLGSASDEGAQAGALWRLANIHLKRSDFLSAIDHAERALYLARRAASWKREAESLSILASIYLTLGDYSRELGYERQALAIYRQKADRKGEALALTNLGAAYLYYGDFAKAFESTLQAVEISEETGAMQKTWTKFNNLGFIHMHWEEYPQALESFQKALQLAKKHGSIIDQRNAELRLGDCYLKLEDWPKAYDLYRKHDSSLRLGNYYLMRGDFEQARSLIEGNLAAAEQNRKSDWLFAHYVYLGQAYEGLRDFERAALYYGKGVDMMEGIRTRIAPADRINFFELDVWGFPRTEPYEGLVRVSQHRPEGIEGSFYRAESTRSRILSEMSARQYGAPQTRIPAALAAEEAKLAEDIAAASQRREAAYLSRSAARLSEFDADLAGLKRRQTALIGRLRQDHPEYASAMYPGAIRPGDIPLKEDEVLIEFAVTGPYTKVFVVKSGRIVLDYDAKIPRRELISAVKRYRGFFEGVQETTQLAGYEPQAGKELYDILLRPALEAVGPDGRNVVAKDSRILIVPDGILGVLPFESLVTGLPTRLQFPSGAHGPVPVGVRYVADDYDIAYYPSAAALAAERNLNKKRKTKKTMFVLADPVFSAADSRARSSEFKVSDASREMTTKILRQMGFGGTRSGEGPAKEIGRDDSEFERLDKTALLAARLGEKVFPPGTVELLSGLNVSKRGLMGVDLSPYKYLLFATHGILDGAVPGINEPALVLNQLGNYAPEDGFLTMSEAMRLRLNADVVALTACQTGLGKRVTGEGVIGMGRAFQFAGAKNVLVSLWNVAEDSTTSLAESFFTQLQEGRSPREALRRARADIRKQGYDHPFYWAPFILIGE